MFGFQDQRAIEYPWTLKQLSYIKRDSLVCDTGCSESLFSHELIARGYRVVGVDIHKYPFKNEKMELILGNLMNLPISTNAFDAIVCISTIEHIGLPSHGQKDLDEFGDMKTMNEFHRILKPSGILIITTPYIGKELIEHRTEGVYNNDRLDKLIAGFYNEKEDFFYTSLSGRRWKKMNRQQMNEQSFKWKGLACVVLRKKDSSL